MKKNIILFSIISLLVLNACNDFVGGDVNVDPNNAADAPIDALLTAVFTSTIITHEGEFARLAAMWARQFTGSDRQYSGFEIYNMNAGDFRWDQNYVLSKNADLIVEKAAASDNKLAAGVAKILKAHTLGMAASLWGDIPYSEALRFPEIEDPRFDEQRSVYQAVLALLDEALADLGGNPTNGLVAGKDFYYGGSAAAWAALARTLKARFHLHLGEHAQALAAAENGIRTSAGDWVIPHTGGAYLQDMNIYYTFGVIDRAGYMTAGEAVLPALLDPASARYRGNAKTDEGARFAFLYTGGAGSYDLNYAGMWGATAPFPLATAVENSLILAEATLRANGDLEKGLDYLNQARALLAAAFPAGRYQPYVAADFQPGGMAAIAGKSAAESLLYEILEEKYASLAGQIEVYNDLRRTDNLLGLTPARGNAFPQRFLVPQVEIDANDQVPSPLPGLFDPTPVNE